MVGAIILQILLVVYHQVTTWFDFFPFNGVRFYSPPQRAIEAGVNFIMMVLPPVGFVFHVPALMKYGVIYYFVVFAVECATWWGPYFFGASPKWAEMHARMHGRTVMVLPTRAGHPAPNLEHLILMVLTLLAAIATLAAYRAAAGEPFSYWGNVLGASAVFAGGTFYQFVLAGRFKSKTTTPR